MARGKFQSAPVDPTYVHQIDTGDNAPVTVDLDNKDPDAFEIAVIDDTPEADRGKPTELDYSLADQEADLRGLSAKTQKRIERLRFETHTERRAKEDSQRERDAALELVRNTQAELARLRLVAESGNAALTNSMVGEREARIVDATRRLEQAHAEGNSQNIAKATADLSMAQGELIAIRTRAPAPAAAQAPVQQQQPARPAGPPIAPRALAWVQKNTWFNSQGADEKSQTALDIHNSLMHRRVDPNSEAYTQELDKRLKAVYPDHELFDAGSSTPRRSNTVAEGSRASDTSRSANPRIVELTATQVSLARKFNIPLQKYAASNVAYQAKLKGAK
jgi:hypothetical protein